MVVVFLGVSCLGGGAIADGVKAKNQLKRVLGDASNNAIPEWREYECQQCGWTVHTAIQLDIYNVWDICEPCLAAPNMKGR